MQWKVDREKNFSRYLGRKDGGILKNFKEKVKVIFKFQQSP